MFTAGNKKQHKNQKNGFFQNKTHQIKIYNYPLKLQLFTLAVLWNDKN